MELNNCLKTETFFCYDNGLECLDRLNKDRLSSNLFTDAILESEGKHFHVHKCIVAIFSNVFQDFLHNNSTAVTKLQWHNSEIVSHILDFIYTGSLNICEENVNDLLAGAHHFKISCIIDHCNNFKSDRSCPVSNEREHWLEILTKLNEDRNCRKHHCDVSITCEKQILYVHKSIVCPFSMYLERVFTIDMCEKFECNVTLGYVKLKALKSVIDLMYSCRIAINEDNVIDILECVDYLEILFVKQFCSNFFCCHTTGQNSLSFYMYAQRYKLENVTKTSLQTFFNKILSIMKEGDFLNLSVNILYELLLMKTSFASNEESVFKAILEWIKHDLHDRKKYIPKFVNCIQFDRLSREFLTTFVLSENLLSNSVVCMQNLFKGLCEHIPSEKSTELLIFGYNQYPAKSRAWKYNVVKKQWFHMAKTFATSFRKDAALAEVNGRLYLMGGEERSDVECLDLSNSTPAWKAIAAMLEQREDSRAASLNRFLYVTGGLSYDKEPLSSCEKYDPLLDKWSCIASMNEPRSAHGLVSLNGFLFAVGGHSDSNGDDCLDSLEFYDPDADVWTTLAPMCCSRNGVAAIVFKDEIFAIGGYSNEDDDEWLASVEKYSPQSNSWCSISSMVQSRAVLFACVADDKIFVVLEDEDGNINSIECYDPQRNEWTVENELIFYLCMELAVAL